MSDGWLREYIVLSVQRGVCIKRVCTTCGSHEFKDGLLTRVGKHMGGSTVKPLQMVHDDEVRSEIAGELSRLDATTPESAVMCLLMILWAPRFDLAIERILGSSWASTVLKEMKAHHASVLSYGCELMGEREAIRARKEARQRARRETHAERLESKKERDRRWRTWRPDAR